MTSIIIPAHNEEAVIGRCLESILTDAEPGEFDIVVVTNGCTDATDEIARGFGDDVRVVDSPVASKPAALTLGDKTAHSFPRMYVDADVEVGASAIRAVSKVLAPGGPADVAAPEYKVHLDDRPWTIKAYYDIWTRLPYISNDLVGSGFYAMNETARSSFDDFPDTMAEDFFVRGVADPDRRRSVHGHSFLAHPPYDLGSLIKIRTRILAANARNKELFDNDADEVRGGHQRALKDLARDPRRWPGLAIYGAVVVISQVRAKKRNRSGEVGVWDRDPSARAAAAQGGHTE